MRDSWDRQCGGKSPFGSYAKAMKSIKSMLARTGRPPRGLRMSAYTCPFCGKFHVGSSLTERDSSTMRKRRKHERRINRKYAKEI